MNEHAGQKKKKINNLEGKNLCSMRETKLTDHV